MIQFKLPDVIKMNKRQREALCDLMDEQIKEQIDEILKQKPEAPTLSKFITNQLLNGTAKIKSEAEILAALKKRIGEFRRYDDLLEGYKEYIKFEAKEFFEVPQEFTDLMKAYNDKVSEIDKGVSELRQKMKSMRLHIMVGSNE